MGKATAKKKNKGKRGVAGAGNVHPLIAQAASNGARLTRGTYEVTPVQNPYGEVVIRGEVRRHKAVRRVPHFETLYRSKVIDRTLFLCLEWYADRLALAQSGMFKCGLDISGSGGGSAFTHIPTTQAAMEARSDVDWARGYIPGDCVAAFDAVMVEGETFIDCARRLCASRYIRLSVQRARLQLRDQFVRAAEALAGAVGPMIMRVDAA